jgi:chromosome segregation ATPase
MAMASRYQSEDVMSDFYDSLKLKMQETLPWRKNETMPAVRLKNGNAAGLTDEIEKLERVVAHRLGRLKEAVTAGESTVFEESHRAEQLVENLRAEITILNEKLKEAEELINRKNLSQQQTEENLSAMIKNLQSDVKSREEILANRENEIINYKSTMEQNIKRMSELEASHTKAQQELADQTRRAEELRKNSQNKIAALEAQLIQTEDLARQKTSAIKQLQQELAAKPQEFEATLKSKDESLAQRDSEIANLKARLNRLTKGISDVSLLFKEAEAMTGVKTHKTDRNEPPPEIADPAISNRPQNDEKIMRILPDALSETVSAETFQRITRELGQATNVIGPLASLMVHQQAKALGESVEKFPRARLPELLEGLAKEISDENLQMYFLQHFTQNERLTLN